jgi:hypothetical protein
LLDYTHFFALVLIRQSSGEIQSSFDSLLFIHSQTSDLGWISFAECPPIKQQKKMIQEIKKSGLGLHNRSLKYGQNRKNDLISEHHQIKIDELDVYRFFRSK